MRRLFPKLARLILVFFFCPITLLQLLGLRHRRYTALSAWQKAPYLAAIYVCVSLCGLSWAWHHPACRCWANSSPLPLTIDYMEKPLPPLSHPSYRSCLVVQVLGQTLGGGGYDLDVPEATRPPASVFKTPLRKMSSR